MVFGINLTTVSLRPSPFAGCPFFKSSTILFIFLSTVPKCFNLPDDTPTFLNGDPGITLSFTLIFTSYSSTFLLSFPLLSCFLNSYNIVYGPVSN